MKSSIRITFQVLSLTALAALCIYLCPRYTNPFKYHFEIGQPWGYSLVTAEYDFPIYKTEAQLEKEYALAMQDYTPCYTLDTQALQSNLYIVPIQEMERIQKISCTHISIINNRISTPIAVENIYTPKSAYQLTKKELAPNLSYDSITSLHLKNNLLSNVSLTHGIVQTGEKIIDTGEIVTEDKYQQLISLRRAMEDKSISNRQAHYSMIGSSICIILLLTVFFLYLNTYRRKLLDKLRHIFFFTI